MKTQFVKHWNVSKNVCPKGMKGDKESRVARPPEAASM